MAEQQAARGPDPDEMLTALRAAIRDWEAASTVSQEDDAAERATSAAGPEGREEDEDLHGHLYAVIT